MEFNVKIQLFPVVVQGVVPAQTDILGPLPPAIAAKEVLQGHKQGIILEPPVVFLQKLLIFGAVADIAPLVGLVEQFEPVLMELVIVHPFRVGAKVHRQALLLCQNPLLYQIIQTDEIGIARKGGIGLIRGVIRGAVAGGHQREDLPIGLTGFHQPVHKIISFLRKAANAVIRGQAGNGK